MERAEDCSAETAAQGEAPSDTRVPVARVGQEVLLGPDPEALHLALAGAGWGFRCECPQDARRERQTLLASDA